MLLLLLLAGVWALRCCPAALSSSDQFSSLPVLAETICAAWLARDDAALPPCPACACTPAIWQKSFTLRTKKCTIG
jgi:hypothetical protein